jgi:hypothetical protein
VQENLALTVMRTKTGHGIQTTAVKSEIFHSSSLAVFWLTTKKERKKEIKKEREK